MKWFYLALLTWIFEILLFVSIIGIPICMYLRYTSRWFAFPFEEASMRI